jgi:protein ImuB
MLWAALIPEELPPLNTPQRSEQLMGLATWCLQYTPRVAILEAESNLPAVVMELEASVRLFGGKRCLVERIKASCIELGIKQLSWASNSGAALCLARAGISHGFAKPLDQLLDQLPIDTLSAAALHHATLMRLGCRYLRQLRALPRGGLSRRFDGQLLTALDQAYGLRPETHVWVILPEHFDIKLELMSRIDHAPAILFAARRLLLQMTAWLAVRHQGVTAFVLSWRHDALRASDIAEGGELTIRTAHPTRDIEHLTRLLSEYLDKTELLAPVDELGLQALEVDDLQERSLSLLPQTQETTESLSLTLERIAARLGPERVLRPVLKEDHRPEYMSQWQAAALAPQQATKQVTKYASKANTRSVDIPQPSFILPTPLALATRENRPLYQGVLQLLIGPHRVEGGWWDRVSLSQGNQAQGQAQDGAKETTRNVTRDYWVALSEHAGVLWIFQTRLEQEGTAWYLHGSFA